MPEPAAAVSSAGHSKTVKIAIGVLAVSLVSALVALAVTLAALGKTRQPASVPPMADPQSPKSDALEAPTTAAAAPTDPEADRLSEETVAALAELNKTIAGVRDQAAVRAALPKVRATVDRIRELGRKAGELKAQGIGPTDWRRSSEAARQMRQLSAALGQEMFRLMEIPGGDELMPEVLRLADVQWAAGAMQLPIGPQEPPREKRP
jgi:hypothetical protein